MNKLLRSFALVLACLLGINQQIQAIGLKEVGQIAGAFFKGMIFKGSEKKNNSDFDPTAPLNEADGVEAHAKADAYKDQQALARTKENARGLGVIFSFGLLGFVAPVVISYKSRFSFKSSIAIGITTILASSAYAIGSFLSGIGGKPTK